MISVKVRLVEEQVNTSAGMPQYKSEEVGEEERYFMPDAVETVQPSTVAAWGSKVCFKSGASWTVREKPEGLAEKVNMKHFLMTDNV